MRAYIITALLLLLMALASSQITLQTEDKSLATGTGEFIPLENLQQRQYLAWEIKSQTEFDQYITFKVNMIDNETHEICWHLQKEAYDDLWVLSKQEYTQKYNLTTDIDEVKQKLWTYPVKPGKGVTTNATEIDITRMGCILVWQDNKEHHNLEIGLNTVTFETVYTSGTLGRFQAFAVDANNVFHYAVQDDTNNDPYYCNNHTGTVSCSKIETCSKCGGYNDIGIDSESNIHTIHRDWDGTDTIRYCTNSSGSWLCEEAYSTFGTGAFYNHMRITPNDNIYFVTSDTALDAVVYCEKDASWSCSEFKDAYDASLDIDSDGNIWVALKNDTLGYLHVLDNTSGTWNEYTDSAKHYRGADIQIADNGTVYVVTHQHTDDYLTLHWYAGGSWHKDDFYTNANAATQGLNMLTDCNSHVHVMNYMQSAINYMSCNNTDGSMDCKQGPDVTSDYLGLPDGQTMVHKKGFLHTSTDYIPKVTTLIWNNTDMVLAYEPITCSQGSDPCDCPGSGNSWEWDFTEDCVLDTECKGITDITCVPGTSANEIKIQAHIDANTYTCETEAKIAINSAGIFALSP